MLEAARNNPGLTNLDTNLKLNKPQVEVNVDRERVADVGSDVATVGRTLETLIGGRQVTRFERNGDQYDVIVQRSEEHTSELQSLMRISYAVICLKKKNTKKT